MLLQATKKPHHQEPCLRLAILAVALLLPLVASGCVSKTEHERLLNEAVAREREHWLAEVQKLEAEKETLRSQAAAELAEARTAAAAELAEARTTAAAEIAQARVAAEELKSQIALDNYLRGQSGAPIEVNQAVRNSSVLTQGTYWLSLLTILITLGALCVWQVRATETRLQLIKLLAIPVSVYTALRFVQAATAHIVSLLVTHEGLGEISLLLLGFGCAFAAHRYYETPRRLGLDLIGISACVILMMTFADLFLLNRELWLASGSALGLRLVVCAPIGAAIFSIAQAVRNLSRKNAETRDSAEFKQSRFAS